MRALRVFLPQLIGVALTTGSAMSGAALTAVHPILSAPCFVLMSVAGVATLITGILKLNAITDDGIDEVDPPRGCKRCAALAKDLDETRRALVELAP